MPGHLTDRLDTCSDRINTVLCHQCTLIVASLVLILMIPIIYLPLKDRDGADWILAAVIFISVCFLPFVCCKLVRSIKLESVKSYCKCETFHKGSKHLGNCLLEVFCCLCLLIPAILKARRVNRGNNSERSPNRRDGTSDSENSMYTTHESGQHISIPNITQNQGQSRGTRGRGKQYHLGALIELACQGDRKTTQRHVDGLSVDSQGVEVHNLYHLYAILSLAHQADNAMASEHYKEWSRLVSSEASSSRGRSDFYGLPTYDQAVALSLETNGIVDVNVLGSTDSRCTSQAHVPPVYNADIPVNVTIPTYDELMRSDRDNNVNDNQERNAEVTSNDSVLIDMPSDSTIGPTDSPPYLPCDTDPQNPENPSAHDNI